MTMRGGGAAGAWGWGSLVSAHASQCGLVVRPTKGFGSRLRWRRGGRGSSVVKHAATESLGHTQWSMRHSHTKATSTNWEKKRWETMAKAPHTGRAMRVLYPVCQVAELAAS